MLKIIYFSRGLSGHDLRFLEGFRRHQVEVGFISLHQLAQPSPVVADGVHVLGDLGVPANPSTGQLLAAIEALRGIVRSFSPDLVVAGPVHDCGFIAARAGLPCTWVTQSWAFDVLWENDVDTEAGDRASQVLRETPALFADCAAVVNRCQELAGRAQIPHFFMPWGLDKPVRCTESARDALRSEMGLREKLVFLHTRRLEPIYAVDTLLHAFERFLLNAPQACLLLASEGSQRYLVEDLIARSAAKGSFRLLGALPHGQLMQLYGAADVFVSCAASDGTSVSLLEAMSAGLPAIVNNRGGNTEWITDGENGWVVPFGSIFALEVAMNAAVRLTYDTKRQMARISQERIKVHANWGANFSRYLAFLLSVAESHRK